MLNRIFAVLGLAFFVLSPLWFGWWIYDDLVHPERWDGGLMHDPRVYLPVVVVGWTLVIFAMRWVYRTNCQTMQQMAELEQIKAMRMMGRTDESSRLMYEYIIKWDVTGERKGKRKE